MRKIFAVLCCLVFVQLFWSRALDARSDFNFDHVAELAAKSAGASFVPPKLVPDFLKQLDYDQYRDIRFDPDRSLWKESGNFQVQLLHPGNLYLHAVAINVYDSEGIRKVAFSPELFNYGKNPISDKIPPDLGFAGFRITYPLSQSKEFNHVLVFAGASYFRAVAKDNVFGLSARGLAINTALGSGEEFPYFKEFWLERPSPKAREMKIYALLDGPRITGAYQFILRPGEKTSVDVKAKLFARKRIEELGIAPLTSMFFYGEARPRPAGEWRPEVHDSDGLLVHTGNGEQIWRPLGNPEKLRVSYFAVENPKGFGLLQRDRHFHSYEDLETRQELRPNAWVVPAGDWGKGQVKLVEIPTPNEANDNIVAYWLPSTSLDAGKSFDLAYRIYFQSSDPLSNHLAHASAMRIGKGDKEDWKRIVVDFSGAALKSLPAAEPLKALIEVGPNGQLVQNSLVKNPVTGSWRLSFQVKPAKGKPLELRAALAKDKDILSETWSYQLEP